MSVQLGHLTVVESSHLPADTAAPAQPAPVAAPRAPQAAVVADVLPLSPPPEALAAVDTAAERAAAMAADDRELHFRTDERSGRIVVEVRDLEGNVIRTIPPSEALDIMDGSAEP